MANRDGVSSDWRHYGDHRPYPDAPTRLSDLSAPIQGVIELPVTIHWGPKRSYDMSSDADRRIVYERVLHEAATTEEVADFVNGSVLVTVWPRLFLPQRIRRRSEKRFPELNHAA